MRWRAHASTTSASAQKPTPLPTSHFPDLHPPRHQLSQPGPSLAEHLEEEPSSNDRQGLPPWAIVANPLMFMCCPQNHEGITVKGPSTERQQEAVVRQAEEERLATSRDVARLARKKEELRREMEEMRLEQAKQEYINQAKARSDRRGSGGAPGVLAGCAAGLGGAACSVTTRRWPPAPAGQGGRGGPGVWGAADGLAAACGPPEGRRAAASGGPAAGANVTLEGQAGPSGEPREGGIAQPVPGTHRAVCAPDGDLSCAKAC